MRPLDTALVPATDRGILHLVKPVEASYENGLLKPAKPLPLTEGEQVRVIVVRKSDPKRWNLKKIAALSEPEDVHLAEAGLDDWAATLEAEDAS
jgi:predicted DNA-binding antitoxin AbrB/MazE fold protein